MILKDIDRSVFEKKVIRTARPVLLCFFKNTIFHSELVVLVEELSRQFKSVRFYVVKEEEHEFFFEKFHFGGTPVFIFLVNGIEKGRLMGTVSAERLRVFVVRNINELNAKRLAGQ